MKNRRGVTSSVVMWRSVSLLAAAICLSGLVSAPAWATTKLDANAINNANWNAAAARSKQISPQIIKAQVLLARARYSPGEIDGRDGENFNEGARRFCG